MRALHFVVFIFLVQLSYSQDNVTLRIDFNCVCLDDTNAMVNNQVITKISSYNSKIYFSDSTYHIFKTLSFLNQNSNQIFKKFIIIDQTKVSIQKLDSTFALLFYLSDSLTKDETENKSVYYLDYAPFGNEILSKELIYDEGLGEIYYLIMDETGGYFSTIDGFISQIAIDSKGDILGYQYYDGNLNFGCTSSVLQINMPNLAQNITAINKR